MGLFLIGLCAPTAPAYSKDKLTKSERAAKALEYKWVTDRLAAKTVSPKFMARLVANVSDEKRDKIIQTNVFGFLRKADYSGHISDDARAKTKAFLKKHKKALGHAESRYGVPPEAVVSLLWVETRLGKRMGSFSLVDVFMNLALADEPAEIANTLEALKAEVPADDPQWKTLPTKIKTVSFNKASWAIDQLVALSEMEKKNKSPVFKMLGSFAGAFGIPQFIPTSFLVYADSPNRKQDKDLFKVSHAIYSVARYLQIHGWDSTVESQKEALWGYNRSRVYGETILELAAQLGMKKALPLPPSPQENTS